MIFAYGSEDTRNALTGIRDLTGLEWYVVPLMAVVFYIWTMEIKKAKATGNWDAITCGLVFFGMDFFNETWNGWVCWFTQDQAFWTTPGPTALRVFVGWNIEIIFMFLINGIVFQKMFSENKEDKILGINNRWAIAIGMTLFSVFIECVLNYAGLLTWVYPFWNRSITGIWLILLIGYFHFYVACILTLKLEDQKKRNLVILIIYSVSILMNVIAAIAGWLY